MRMRRFELKNFKGLQSLAFDWEDLIVLIGPNNAGKSSALSALTWFLSGSSIRDASFFRKHETDEAHAIELIGYFDKLTAEDLEQVAIKGRSHNGEWILKKKYWYEAHQEDGVDRGGEWVEKLFSFGTSEVFSEWPEPDTAWRSFPDVYQPLIENIQDRPPRPNAASRDALRDLVRRRKPELLARTEAGWIPNPGGGGNWKSNANSILPRLISIRAVHDASDEIDAKDASTYGKLINLIVERQLAQREEMQALHAALDAVMALFRPDQEHPERQAAEIRELQERINQSLSDVIAGQALIRTEPPELRALVMPSTSLLIRDPSVGIETQVGHQGHGLQRTLVMTLLQILVETQEKAAANDSGASSVRPAILMVEEPELYMHPQMERRMRDVINRLSVQDDLQVICCTHSPVFLDIADRYRSIVRLVKNPGGSVLGCQFTGVLLPGQGDELIRSRMQAVARFNPAVNELFFAGQVVLMEERSAIVAFELAAELTGLFRRHPSLRHDICFVDCVGKGSIPGFQTVLNKFDISYRVIHDADIGNATAMAENQIIANVAAGNPRATVYQIQPSDLESLLGYTAGKDKPFRAYKKVGELHGGGGLPPAFIEALNMAYFGSAIEPVA